MNVKVQFLGAAGTVTGSKYLIRCGDNNILVDVGLFQGRREHRELNWEDPPCDLSKIDCVLLTHAHIDHTGMLPRYYRLGLRCAVYASAATRDLCGLMLPDSARLQEEEAEYRAQRGKSRHKPPLPLYTEPEARSVLKLFKSIRFGERIEVVPGVFAQFSRVGHILGAASIKLEVCGKSITFSGDLGRYSVPVLRDPEPVKFGDLLLIESTYGDRLHPQDSPKSKLRSIISETAGRGGVVVIPSFAVGRAQALLYYLRELKEESAIPDIPIVVDSPMATDATEIYSRHRGDYDEDARVRAPFRPSKLGFTADRNESIKLNSITEPMVIISASGMLSGGRILHHLKHRIASPLNTILFVGYQPPGGRGAWIKSGAESLRIFGDEIPIRAQIEEIEGLSAHGDREEMLRWCRESSGKPDRVAVVHGEPDSARSFAHTLKNEFNWNAFVPSYLQEIEF